MNGADEARLRQYHRDLDSIWTGVGEIAMREEGEGETAIALHEITQGICQAVMEIEDWLGIEAD